MDRNYSQHLEYAQQYRNRPKLVCRVFHAKFLQFLRDVADRQLFGVVLNYTYAIEFQKRGLPHAHIVITFRPEDEIPDAATIE